MNACVSIPVHAPGGDGWLVRHDQDGEYLNARGKVVPAPVVFDAIEDADQTIRTHLDGGKRKGSKR